MHRWPVPPSSLTQALLLVLLLAAATPGRAADEAPRLAWDHREAVRYQENHDPSMVWLTDGRKLQVHYGTLSWEKVDRWRKDRALTLRYTAADGLQLVDDATGQRVRVLGGMEHPLDKLLERNLGKNESTLGMAECYSQATRQWQLEMDRTLKELRAALPAQESRAVQAAQDAWGRFRDAEQKAINAIHSREGTGSMSTVQAAAAHLKVIRDRTLALQQHLADVW